MKISRNNQLMMKKQKGPAAHLKNRKSMISYPICYHLKQCNAKSPLGWHQPGGPLPADARGAPGGKKQVAPGGVLAPCRLICTCPAARSEAIALVLAAANELQAAR